MQTTQHREENTARDKLTMDQGQCSQFVEKACYVLIVAAAVVETLLAGG